MSDRSRVRPLAVTVIGSLVGLGLFLALRGPDEVTAPSMIAPTATLAPTLTSAQRQSTPSPSPTPEPRPAWVVDLVGQLECDGIPADFGEEVPDYPGPFEPAPTPDKALDIARMLYWNLPASGFEPTLVEGNWARHRYLVEGRPKAIAVSTNQYDEVPTETGWQVVGLRACDPSEFANSDFGPGATTIWLDAAGHPVRTTDVITSSVGPGHCGWERTIFLSLGPNHTQYFRDPHHELEQYSVVPFDADVRLPDDATDTGLHTDEWHMFTIPSGRAAFMRTPDGTVELWPRARESIGCA